MYLQICSAIYMYMCIIPYSRAMVKAMQDPEAGINLTEFGMKRGKGATKYFTGTHVHVYTML